MTRGKKGLLNTYVDNIVTAMGEKNSNYAFIKHYGKYSINDEDVASIKAAYEDIEVCYIHFANSEMVGSYEPFMSIIKDCYKKYYSDLTIEEYLDKFDIYELHKAFFMAYIDRCEIDRNEPLLLGEIAFEKKMMWTSFVNIIIALSKEHPLLIMMDNAHVLPVSSIRVLRYVFEHPENQNIGVIASYNDLKYVAGISRDQWNSFINMITVKGCVFEGVAYKKGETAEEYSGFIFERKQIYEYIHKMKCMYYTVELERAEYYLQKITRKISDEKIDIDVDSRFDLFCLYTEVLINLGDFATALIICDELKKMCEVYGRLECGYYHYLFGTYIQMYSRKNEFAKDLIVECKKIAEKLNDEKLIFRAELVEYMIDMYGWHNIFFVERDADVTDEFLERIKANKYYNHLANFYIYGFENNFEPYKDAKTIEEIECNMVRYRKGIDLAKKLGNTSLVLKACYKLTMMSSAFGAFNITQEYYERSFEYLKDGSPKEIADAKNGHGYVSCTSRYFKKANECYNTALDNFIALGDIRAVGETLYNMSVNCILALDYNAAFTYLKACVRIVEKMRLNDLRVCNLAKLYGLLALSATRLCYESDSNFYLDTNRKFLDYIINQRTYKLKNNKKEAFSGNDDELFLHYFVKGAIHEMHDENEEALQYYKIAEKHCLKSLGNMFFSYVQLYVAMAEVYRKLDDEASAIAMIDKAYAYAKEKNYTEQMALLERMRQGEGYNQEKIDCPLENHTIEQIDELLDVASAVMKNSDMKDQIEFISVWQNIIEINDKTQEELITTAANSFMSNFNLDSFVYIEYKENSATVLYNDGAVELSNDDLEMLREYFERRKTGFVIAKTNKDYEYYKQILDLFEKDLVCSMVCSPYYENEKLDSLFISCIYIKTDWNVKNYRYFLNEDEASIFNLLLRQLLIAVDKIENLNEIKHMNEALKQSSLTDYLTGLRNRNGLYDSFVRMLKESKKCGNRLDLAVLYIDLDNFKYYNDTFGHDVGDLMLKEVAAILNNITSENGFAIRYGGDEFLILLENTDKEDAISKAQSILDALTANAGYADRISEFLGRPVEVKEGKKLSCSIGVAMKTDISAEKDLSELLMHADSSLYDVKNTTKNAIKYYE